MAEERNAAAELIEHKLAKREAFRKPLKLDVFRYDDPLSDTPFLANRSAQASVDQRSQSTNAEIVVAILWARMGTPVRDPNDPAKVLYQSGTEQEIEEALKAGREVLIYFRRGQPPAPDDDDGLEKFKEQRQKVRAFRARLQQGGRGVNDYQDVEDFRRKLEQHLDQRLTRIAARYRIAFTVPQQFRAAYLALGHPNSAKTGSKGYVLPIPATYVLDSTGLVVLSYLDADHTTRLEPT